ncbi:hypothetical protein POX_a00614 [Penicillium oxalicum]|uniref:hypothetical protein n=1 Tax=Penicillium oxalicum TaxID=69781 RepID=UPI0020B6891A|nr:hypothetical protein POX_a00614 [Penicillium oxalicum]KAI2794024.1 hypothetical protein POX_a00614 [Penicillium oxalicum]
MEVTLPECHAKRVLRGDTSPLAISDGHFVVYLLHSPWGLSCYSDWGERAKSCAARRPVGCGEFGLGPKT